MSEFNVLNTKVSEMGGEVLKRVKRVERKIEDTEDERLRVEGEIDKFFEEIIVAAKKRSEELKKQFSEI